MKYVFVFHLQRKIVSCVVSLVSAVMGGTWMLLLLRIKRCFWFQPESQRDIKMLSVLLPFVLTFTSLSGWKVLNSKAGLCCTLPITRDMFVSAITYSCSDNRKETDLADKCVVVLVLSLRHIHACFKLCKTLNNSFNVKHSTFVICSIFYSLRVKFNVIRDMFCWGKSTKPRKSTVMRDIWKKLLVEKHFVHLLRESLICSFAD